MTTAKHWQRKLGATLAFLLTVSVLAACSEYATETPDVPGLAVTITGPADGTIVDSSTITMSCEIGSAVTQASYSLNGGEPVPLTFTERSYSFEVEGLVEGENTVALTVDDDDPATAPVTVSASYRYDGRRGGDDMEPRNLIALDADNTLVLFNSGDPDETDTRRVRGVRGTLLGIDYRPANGLLYGLDSSNRLYVIDVEQGRAREVSRLDVRFNGGSRSGFDFNPVVDRLRLTGTNDQNFRTNVDTGIVIVDGDLAYAAGDENAGQNPAITGSAYRNAFAGATVTELYGIDAELNVLVEQNPPNDGTLLTTGELGFDVSSKAGFDIVTDEPGNDDSNVAYVLSDGDLYKVDLETGASTSVGTVPGGSFSGLAVVPSGN